MKCPKCGYITFDNLERCKRCGEEWDLRPEHSLVSAAATRSTLSLELSLDEEFERLYQHLKSEEEKASRVRWGGFLRRSAAFFVDVWVLAIFSLLLFYFAYLGFSIGLAAHHRQLSWVNAGFFLRIFFFAWFFLVSGYFVLLHGLEGKTVGKWLLGLRVVGAQDQPITYGQAFVRWIGTLISGLFGLGMMWVIWEQEKRGWHDLLARTWVIREWARASSKG